MEKYKISDLLLVHEDKLCRVVYQFNRDCRFAVLNKDKTKIKIITKDEVHLVNDPLLKDYTGESQTFAHLYQVYAYETKDGIRVFPIYLKQDDLAHIEYDHRYISKNFSQFDKVLDYNKINYSEPIFKVVFNNPDRFIDEATIRKIEKAINIAESSNEYNLKKEEKLDKQKRKNLEYEKTYNQTLEF